MELRSSHQWISWAPYQRHLSQIPSHLQCWSQASRFLFKSYITVAYRVFVDIIGGETNRKHQLTYSKSRDAINKIDGSNMFYLELFWINLHGFDCYKQAREANKKKCSRVNSWPNELNYLRWSCKLFNEHIFSIEVFCLMIWSNVFFPVKRMFVTLVSHVATLFSCGFGPLYIWWHTTHYKHTVRITICVVCWWFVFFFFPSSHFQSLPSSWSRSSYGSRQISNDHRSDG